MRRPTETVEQASGTRLALSDERISRVRQRTLEALADFPGPFGKSLTDQFLLRAHGNNAFELGPWLIADALGIEATDEIEELASRWALLHVYTLCIDDCIDEPGLQNRAILEVAAGLCLERGLIELFAFDPNFLVLKDQMITYAGENALAVGNEVLGANHEGLKAATCLYRRMSVAKIWASLLLCHTGELYRLADSMEAVEHILNALQLRDDIIDCEADFLQGRRTLLLNELNLRLEPSVATSLSSSPNSDVLLGLLLVTRTMEDALVLEQSFIERFETRSAPRTSSRKYAAQLVSEAELVLTILRETLSSIHDRQDAIAKVLQNDDTFSTKLRDFRVKTNVIWGPYNCH
jgi:hypothetical protein